MNPLEQFRRNTERLKARMGNQSEEGYDDIQYAPLAPDTSPGIRPSPAAEFFANLPVPALGQKGAKKIQFDEKELMDYPEDKPSVNTSPTDSNPIPVEREKDDK